MPTIDRLSTTEAVSWVRSRAERIRNSAATRHPLVRWAVATVSVMAVVAMGYLVTMSATPLSQTHLAGGRSFSSDDLVKVFRALDEKHIEYHPDDRRRVAVLAEQYDQASAIVAKLDVGRHSVGEIRDESNSWSVLEGPREKERRELVRREKMLEAMVTQFQDVAWAVVSLKYPQSHHFLQARGKPSAFVFVETDGDRLIPDVTVQSISSCLVANEPEITADSITVMDRRGHLYLEAGKPGQGDLSRTRAREEKLREEIAEKLNSIKGVEVLVSLASGRGEGSGTSPGGGGGLGRESAMAKPSDSTQQDSESEKHGGTKVSRPFVPKTSVNAPLGPLPERERDSDGEFGKREEPGAPSRASDTARIETERPRCEGGRVVVTVPRSFYYNAIMTIDHREPSHEELKLAAEKMEPQIKSKVSLVVQDAAAWKVEIYTSPDEVDLGRRAMLASASEQRRKALDWGLVGAGAAAVAMLVALASWIQVARSPGRRTDVTRGTRRYHADSPTAPAPSERVRELVRRNPETAASVLQRWTAQGGGLP
jgi:flagellar M-ring protein FliF